MPGKAQLYSYYRSTSSYRVRIALHLKKVDFDYHTVHLVEDGGQQHSGAFKQQNPMGQVPYFVHGEVGLSQSMAILDYIDRTWPEPLLFPDDATQHAVCIQICEMINSGIQPLQNLSTIQYLQKQFGDQVDRKDWSVHWIHKGFVALEAVLKDIAGDYCLADTLSAADLLLIPQIYNADRFEMDMQQFPTLNRINQHCLQLEAFQKAHPDNQPDTE